MIDKTLTSILLCVTALVVIGGLMGQTPPQTELQTLTAKITALDAEVKTLKNTSADFVTGPSGALDCASIPGQCDLVTAIVPFKASANEFTGLDKFFQLQLAVYTMATLPACTPSLEGKLIGVSNATGSTPHVPMYCNGTQWEPL
jgi:hypothetical protein